MFWYGVATGSAVTFFFMFLVLAFTKSTRDQEWMEEERNFRAELVMRWKQSHEDNETRNGFLEEIRDRILSLKGW